MTGMRTTRCYRPDPSRIGQPEAWARARARAALTADSIVITVAGEIDASNACELVQYVDRHSAVARRLYLDLSEVTFFATAGIAVLRRIECDFAERSADWRLIAGPAVRKVMRICGADDLPQLGTLDGAPGTPMHATRVLADAG